MNHSPTEIEQTNPNVYLTQNTGDPETIALVSIRDEAVPEFTILDPTMLIILVSTLIAVVLLIRVWKNQSTLFERLFWTVFLFIPVFGPLFFLVFYPGSSEMEARRWASVDAANHFGGGGRMGL